MENQTEQSITSFDDLINQIDNTAGDVQRERGTLFERLVLAYLKNEPIYKNLYKHVWMLNNVPEQYGIPKRDTGVDLVAEQYDGTLTAVQVKFYKEGTRVGKSEIDSFVAELGKDYYQHGLIVSSTDNWNRDAKQTIEENSKNPQIIGISDLRNSKIDWSQFNFARPEKVALKNHKQLRPYQKEALHNALNYYQNHDRGMMIMAPGTGKTFTSLKITEAMAKQKNGQFRVLYLVPSIQLLTQSLRGWNNDTDLSITNMAVTSDRNASRDRSEDEDIKGMDIGYPATTNSNQLMKNYHQAQQNETQTDLMVVFSTYQSIEVLGAAQKDGFPEFDLIIADEAHRTTGAKQLGANSSFFTKVHSNTNVKGVKRLYQTATPKIYGDNAKKNAKDKSIILSSMDDPEKFGEVFYRLGFGQAVSHGILTDYKVMVLAVDEATIQKDMQKTLSDTKNGLEIGDVGKIIGIWNGMMRRNSYKNPKKHSEYNGAPLERAIAFTNTIASSKLVANKFEDVVNDYLDDPDEQSVHVNVRHADGGMNALEKGDVLDWLSSPNKPSDEARIISNARFLTEGVDIPALDAIIFLAPKNSQVDIVQAVGRIMRKSPDKEFGYVILPIVIPSGETPETVLDNNDKYKAIWQVINALRSVDERFEAMIDKLRIGGKPKQLIFEHPDGSPHAPNDLSDGNSEQVTVSGSQQTELDLQWEEFKEAIYGKIVQRVGNRKYLDNWSGDVAKIAQRQIAWIKNKLADKNDPIRPKFKEFVNSLQHNINDGIDDNQAAEMISQHLITKPIFDALFSDYDFVKSNPVSMAMEKMVKVLESAGFAKEQASLEPLYESIKMRAEGIDDPKDKQKIIVTLYNQFFATAFKSTTERLGIVFTPIEVVDFIVNSVDFALKKYFDKSLASKNVHVLDPFTGTGTFVVRTLTHLKEQVDAGKITMADVAYKYTNELHANEIVLLSYYIAAINIESTFADIDNEKGQYKPFDGIVLTDTFESTENESTLDDSYFGTNDERLKKEQETPITAIISNPPYSKGQKNEDDNQTKTSYPTLEKSIKQNWSTLSTATNKNSLSDSYIKGIRWALDRINNSGVVGFITNNSFIDGFAMDGMRKSLLKECTNIFIIDLKGQIRQRNKEQRAFEGENIFNILTGVSIEIFVKDSSKKEIGKIKYLDIGNNLSKKQKLSLLSKWKDIGSVINEFTTVTPNEKGDWINQRDSNFDELIKMGDKKNKDALFLDYSGGIKTGRDSYTWGFSKQIVESSMKDSINYYDENLGNTIIYDTKTPKISWTASLKKLFEKKQKLYFEPDRMFIGMFRPFTKKYVYYSKEWTDRQYRMNKIFPNNSVSNEMISFSNKTAGKKLSSLFLNVVPCVDLFTGNSQNFPLKFYDNLGSYSSIRDNILKEINGIDRNQIIYYIYGVLHSKEYQEIYFDDLSKSLPRIPNVIHKSEYVKIGKLLSELHLNYEKQKVWNGIKIDYNSDNPSYAVNKMKHPLNNDGNRARDLTTIIYNDDITITNIPKKAYEYVVNGKPAIEWIIDQYRIKKDKKSGITDDPNEFSDDPKYILNLLLSVITVSMKTLELVDQLPKFEVIEEDK